MPVKKDASGRRSVEAEVQVPGTPEEVWQAIATGPGISSWFVPSEVDGRVGGAAVSHFAPNNAMDSVGKITAWQPPSRFAVETHEGQGPGPVATEWIVEARGGGTCVVRVVHSWVASTDDWDKEFEGHTQGWAGFFRILRLYLTHFPGQHGSSFQVMGTSQLPTIEAWQAFLGPLGLMNAQVGQHVRTASGAPPLSGVVEGAGQSEWPHEMLLRLDEPAPGLAHAFPLPMGGQVYLVLRVYVFGARASEIAADAEPTWRTWIGTHFAAVG